MSIDVYRAEELVLPVPLLWWNSARRVDALGAAELRETCTAIAADLLPGYSRVMLAGVPFQADAPDGTPVCNWIGIHQCVVDRHAIVLRTALSEAGLTVPDRDSVLWSLTSWWLIYSWLCVLFSAAYLNYDGLTRVNDPERYAVEATDVLLLDLWLIGSEALLPLEQVKRAMASDALMMVLKDMPTRANLAPPPWLYA